MLNKSAQRELAYVVQIDNISPISGADRVEAATVGGWQVMVRKGQFEKGGPAIYFEIDSRVPAREPFMFLEKNDFKIKTQRYFKGKFISQGLLMSAEDVGWKVVGGAIVDSKGVPHYPHNESRFLTAELGVTHSCPDGINPEVKPEKRPFFYHWLMRFSIGRKILSLFPSSHKGASTWPSWVRKTDEERIQNIPEILQEPCLWIGTEKIDGTSATFTVKRFGLKKPQFFVCSRNICLNENSSIAKKYFEIAKRYKIQEALMEILHRDPELDFVTLQGEIYGKGIQKRDYSLEGTDFAAFNLITSKDGRFQPFEMQKILSDFKIPSVPILGTYDFSAKSVEDVLGMAKGESKIDGGDREGVVFRSPDGQKSFKAVSNDFLLKYHS